MANIFKERVHIGVGEDGKALVKWATGSTKRELHDSIVRLYVKYGMIDSFLKEVKRENAEEKPQKCILLREYYESVWLPIKEKQVKKTTLTGYKAYFSKHLLPEFGDRNMFEIRPFDIQTYFDSKANLSLKTQREHYNVLCALFDYAMDDERVMLPRNPARSKHVALGHSSKPAVEREALSSDIIQEIVSKIGDLPDDHRRLMALFLFTGMRRGEVLGLRWEDLDLEKKSIEVKRNATYADNQAEITSPKTTNGYRTLPLYGQLIEFLAPLGRKGFIIGGKSMPISLTQYKNMFSAISKRIDLHDATAHVFRHSYLTMLDEAGVDPKTLQYIAGHGNFSFTMNRYVHGRERAALNAGEKFENLLATGNTASNLSSLPTAAGQQ